MRNIIFIYFFVPLFILCGSFNTNNTRKQFPANYASLKENPGLKTIQVSLSQEVDFESGDDGTNQFAYANYDKIINFKLDSNATTLIDTDDFEWEMSFDAKDHLKSNIKGKNNIWEGTYELKNYHIKSGDYDEYILKEDKIPAIIYGTEIEWELNVCIKLNKVKNNVLTFEWHRPKGGYQPSNSELFLNWRRLELKNINLIFKTKLDLKYFDNFSVDLNYKYTQSNKINDILIDKIKKKFSALKIDCDKWNTYFKTPQFDADFIEKNSRLLPNYCEFADIKIKLTDEMKPYEKFFVLPKVTVNISQNIDLENINLNKDYYEGQNIEEIIEDIMYDNFYYKSLLKNYCNYSIEEDKIVFKSKDEYSKTITGKLEINFNIIEPEPINNKIKINEIIRSESIEFTNASELNYSDLIDKKIKNLVDCNDEKILYFLSDEINISIDFDSQQILVKANEDSKHFEGEVKINYIIFSTPTPEDETPGIDEESRNSNLLLYILISIVFGLSFLVLFLSKIFKRAKLKRGSKTTKK